MVREFNKKVHELIEGEFKPRSNVLNNEISQDLTE